jgi:acetyltransferase-like isoleucine patch superfamily enzyme
VKGKRVYLYKNSRLSLHSDAKIIIYGSLHFNSNKVSNSRSEGLLRIDQNAQLLVEGNFRLYYGCDVAIYNNATLRLGSGFINAGGQIRCGESITIGDNVAIGRNFFVQDSDFHTIIDRNGNRRPNTSPVVIGNHVWIGSNVVVLKGVHIGDNAVIGAGTIVTKDVLANTVVAGTPNRVLMNEISWE